MIKCGLRAAAAAVNPKALVAHFVDVEPISCLLWIMCTCALLLPLGDVFVTSAQTNVHLTLHTLSTVQMP